MYELLSSLSAEASLVGALIGHLVGDFVLQNDYMAAGKKRSSGICAMHCAVWTFCVCMFGTIWNPLIWLWLFGTHFLIDRWYLVPRWMDLIGQKRFKVALAPWSAIIVDSVFHMVTIWLVVLK